MARSGRRVRHWRQTAIAGGTRTGTSGPNQDGGPRDSLRSARHPASQPVLAPRGISLGVAMNDLLVIGMTIVIFAVFFLIVKGVEHLER